MQPFPLQALSCLRRSTHYFSISSLHFLERTVPFLKMCHPTARHILFLLFHNIQISECFSKSLSSVWLGAVAAAAAKSLQSCLTLCDPRDGSPLGSTVPGILQARILEWVVISFSSFYCSILKFPLVSLFLHLINYTETSKLFFSSEMWLWAILMQKKICFYVLYYTFKTAF